MCDPVFPVRGRYAQHVLAVSRKRIAVAGCHDQHKTVQQWRESRYPDLGLGCLECHMPFRDGDPNRGRDHTSMGGHDLELVRSAVELRGVRVEKKQ